MNRLQRLNRLTDLRREVKREKWLELAPEPVPWERLRWLGIPPRHRAAWVLAPSMLNYGEAERWAAAWAKRNGGQPELVALSTGETLVRLEPVNDPN